MITKELTKTQLNCIYDNMMSRCYNEKVQELKPWYKGVTVCDLWKNDMYAFYEWVNDGNFYVIPGEKTNVELDHNILVKGNKVYSPETSIFAPKSINSMIGGSSKKADNGLPIGVIEKDGKYRASIIGKRVWFDTPEEAWEIYAKHKKAHIVMKAEEYYGKIPMKLYDALINWKVEITD